MLVYRLCKSTYIIDPLSAEGARRAGGLRNPKGFPILYTSATPELALLEVVAHLDPSFIPKFHLLVLEIPDVIREIKIADLPVDWREQIQGEDTLQLYLSNWLNEPDCLTLSVPSAIVSRSRNYLIHNLYPGFNDEVKVIENELFSIDGRVIKG